MSDTDNRQAPPTPATARPLQQCRTLSEVFQTREFEQRIAQALPSHMKTGTILRSFIQATSRNPDLLKCDLRQSIGGFLTLAELGLPLTPTLGMAHMIPFKGRVLNRQTRRWEDGYTLQIIIGYQGLLELAMRTGMVGGIHAEVVWPGDDFAFRLGTQQYLNHTPKGDHAQTAKPTHAWAIAHFRGAETMPPFEVYPWAKVLGIRDRSQGYLKALNAKTAALAEGKAIPRTWTDAPWVRDEEAMGKKTMLRALSKYLPKSAELQGATAVDDPDRGYVDFSPIIDAQPGDVHAVDLPVEEEPGDAGAAYGVRQQAEPILRQTEAVAAAAQSSAQEALRTGGASLRDKPAAKAPPTRPKAAEPPPAAEEEPPPADPSDFGLGSIPQSHAADAPQQALPQQEGSDFEAYVFDEVGEAVSDLYTDPAKWAAHLHAVYDPADIPARNQIVENNMDALAAARPYAVELLRDVMIRKPPAAAAAPKAPAIEAVAVPQTRGGKPDWVGYMKAVRDVLPHIGVSISAEPWVNAQLPALAECPTTQRINLIGDIAKRMSEFGQKPPAALAALVQAKPTAAAPAGGLFGGDADRAWVDASKAEIDACATRDEIAAITKSEATTIFLRGLRERNTGLVQELVAHATTRANSLEAPA